MTLAADLGEQDTRATKPQLVEDTRQAAERAQGLLETAREALKPTLAPDGRPSNEAMEREQHRAHGLAWLATYVEALRQLAAYAARMDEEDRFGELEMLIVRAAFAEYLAQICGGIPMSQTEVVRPTDLGLDDDDLTAFRDGCVSSLMRSGSTPEVRARIAELLQAAEGAATFGDGGLDETYEAMRDEMRRFATQEVLPHAHEWHLANDYIPLDTIGKMAELGVFGLTIS